MRMGGYAGGERAKERGEPGGTFSLRRVLAGRERKREKEKVRYMRRGMRATFLLFIVSRCLCFTRPSRAALHDNAGKGGISEGTNNVMYYT